MFEILRDFKHNKGECSKWSKSLRKIEFLPKLTSKYQLPQYEYLFCQKIINTSLWTAKTHSSYWYERSFTKVREMRTVRPEIRNWCSPTRAHGLYSFTPSNNNPLQAYPQFGWVPSPLSRRAPRVCLQNEKPCGSSDGRLERTVNHLMRVLFCMRDVGASEIYVLVVYNRRQRLLHLDCVTLLTLMILWMFYWPFRDNRFTNMLFNNCIYPENSTL